MQTCEAKKYLGGCCGNTFIILDSRDINISENDKITFSVENINKYQVDSAIIINNIQGFDLFLEIFEKDGSKSESCGNGLILVSYLLEIKEGRVKFGNSIFNIGSGPETKIISIDTDSVYMTRNKDESYFVKVGEPHLIYFVNDISKFDLIKTGEESQKNYKGGVNVDAVQKIDDFHYLIRTYERGVFAETKSCGTGSMSSFFASRFSGNPKVDSIDFKSAGGDHWVSIENNILSLEVLTEYCHVECLK